MKLEVKMSKLRMMVEAEEEHLSGERRNRMLTPKNYLRKKRRIWKELVPSTGQAETVQGELLRAIEKLRDEAQRNGNANFHESCHTILIEYLRHWLTSKEIFDEQTLTEINSDLDKLKKKDEPYLKDDIYERIGDRIIDWCMRYNDPITNKRNEELTC